MAQNDVIDIHPHFGRPFYRWIAAGE